MEGEDYAGGESHSDKPKILYSTEVSHEICRLSKKNPQLLEKLLKKLEKLSENPDMGERLSYGLSSWQSVHVGNSYVAIFKANYKENYLLVGRFDKHDKAYHFR